jgi:hypothetical protein
LRRRRHLALPHVEIEALPVIFQADHAPGDENFWFVGHFNSMMIQDCPDEKCYIVGCLNCSFARLVLEVMDLMSLCLCGIPLLIVCCIPLFIGVSYLRGSEWLWHYERGQNATWGVALKREDWERARRFKGVICSFFGTLFLLAWLVMLFNSF